MRKYIITSPLIHPTKLKLDGYTYIVINLKCLCTEDVHSQEGTDVLHIHVLGILHELTVVLLYDDFLFAALIKHFVVMSANGHLAVQRNAFSTAVAAAKVCDGRCSSSIAERISSASVFDSPKGQLLFVLFPSIQNHEIVAKWDANDPNTEEADVYTTSATIHALASWSTTNSAGTKNAFSPDQFRLVSAGMRLSSINAADSNNGWFEAIRITPSWSVNEFGVNEETKAITPDVNTFEGGMLLDKNWANHPSYITGRMRDIGKHTFYLQNCNGDRSFKRYSTNQTIVTTEGYMDDKFGVDNNFDVVAIRVKSTASTTDTLKTSIHVHTVKNWETMYDGKNPLSRFHTSTISAESMVKNADKQMTRDCKPSMIRSASSYAYKY